MQELLFAATWGEDETPDDRHSQLRVAALNVQGGGGGRTVGLAVWLARTRADVLVLSELRLGNAPALLGELRALGYTVREPDPSGSERTAVVAVKPEVLGEPFEPSMDRVSAVNLRVGERSLVVVGVYAPTNGMSAESSAVRAAWQRQFLRFVEELPAGASTVISGDLNVLEPGHIPSLPFFEEHDYRFYSGLVECGFTDCFRHLSPTETDHSWYNPRYGAQRIDHTFVTTAMCGSLTGCRYDAAPVQSGISDHSGMITDLDLDAL